MTQLTEKTIRHDKKTIRDTHPYFIHKPGGKNDGFTLAEVLITLGIIGVVSALTIPSLVTKINNKVKVHQIQVIQRKISQGVEGAQVRGALVGGFNSTMDFINELAKDMKIITICDQDNLRNCWPYDKILLDDFGTEVTVADKTDGKRAFLKTEGEWGETVGIVMGNGVPMLLSYKKNCIIDPDSRYETDKDSGISEATQCLAGIYELNGPKSPNKYGQDVMPFNTIGFGKRGCLYKFGNSCITTNIKTSTSLKISDYCSKKSDGSWSVNDLGSYLGINYCCTSDDCLEKGDYWAGAVKECGGVDKLLSLPQFTKLKKILYDDPNASQDDYHGTLNTNNIPVCLSNYAISSHYLWLKTEYDQDKARFEYSTATYSSWSHSSRSNKYRFVCVE